MLIQIEKMVNKVYKNLNAEMVRKGIKTSDVSDLLGISKYRAENMMYGKVKISVIDAIKIRNKFFKDMSIEYLFYV